MLRSSYTASAGCTEVVSQVVGKLVGRRGEGEGRVWRFKR